MNAEKFEPDELPALVRDMAELIDASPLQREILDAAMRSVASAMLRVQPSDRDELQSLVAAFLTNPDDAETRARIGGILSRAPKPKH